MSFQPVVIGSGLTAWASLKSTMAYQKAAFSNRADISRQVEHFRSVTATHETAEDLVADRRALTVALGAHGLIDDLGNSYFVGRVLAEGVEDDRALANKLSDDRYRSLAEEFSPLNYELTVTQTEVFADEVVEKYHDVAFETAIGDIDGNMRIALAFHRLLPEVAEDSTTNDAAWYRIMGRTALRSVFETAFGLPSSFSQLDVDRQLEDFKDKAMKMFGTDQVSDIGIEENREKLVQRFLIRAQLNDNPSAASAQTALALVTQTATFMRSLT